MKKYNPKSIESKWQKFWLKQKTFATSNNLKLKKKYVLVEFPYPSGAGLHMGHMRPFVAGDVVSKYFKLNGFNTMYPMGWDAFGLPAENYAIKNKVHPSVSTAKNVANAKKQLMSWGTGFDWSREINTTDPQYYKWTQKLFLEFFKAGLAYEKFGEINWCPKDKTGLANEEVVDGKCERCGTVVEKKNLRQWYLKITDYAEKLLEGLKDLPEWPEAVKIQQENWIGKSEGAEIEFKPTANSQQLKAIKVFTTRADTIFGATYLVLAPEHSLIQEILSTKSKIQNKHEIEEYLNKTKNKTEDERTNDKKEKTGVEIKGIKAINPANQEEIPVWVADYVLGNYGTGAIMAVPAHDERDFAFAKKYNLPIKYVIAPQCILVGNNAPKENVETISRRTVSAIIKHNKENKYLVLNEPDNFLFPGGGIEANESIEVALRREIIEETGYKNFVIKEKFLEGLFCSGFRYPKQKNQESIDTFFFVELLDEERIQSEADSESHSTLWLSPEEISKKISFEHQIWAWKIYKQTHPVTDLGVLMNSNEFNGLRSVEAQKKITEFVGGKIVTKFKLRDWVFSRQRYWGEPIPLIHCEKCGIVAVPEKDLPVKLPQVKKYEPTGTGESPLASVESWVNTKCPKCVEDSEKTKYLVFDFDGVIGDTYEANLKARVAVGWAKDYEDSIKKTIEYFSKRPSHANGHSYSKEELSGLLDKSQIFGQIIKDSGVKLFEGFVSEVKRLKNCKIALISSGCKVYVNIGAKKSKLKFDTILTLDDSFSKEEKLERIAKKWKVDMKELYYFTDANCDVYELENIMDRRKIIGCSWGFLGFEELRKTLPENQILRKPKDIHSLFIPRVGRRETNTMPQWAGSSWYWLRYMDPKNKNEFSSLKTQKYWSPVVLYFGGMEHTTLHLLYSRFWNLFLYDRGLVAVKEPYKKRVPHGIILGPDGEKMSKSRGNVVNPDDIIKIYGADTVRLYMMFLGPHGAQIAWNDKGIVGARRFIERVFNLPNLIVKEEDIEVTKTLHKTIKKITEDLGTFSFNTAVSAMMIFMNKVNDHKGLTKSSLNKFITLIAPFIPHSAEEVWKNIGNKKSIFSEKWPKFDSKLTIDSEIDIVIQVNGKLRGKITVEAGLAEESVLLLAKSDQKVAEYLLGQEVKKAIYIKDKLVNFVI